MNITVFQPPALLTDPDMMSEGGEVEVPRMRMGGFNPASLNLNIDDAESVSCDECGNEYFTAVVMIKRISPLVSPTGQEALVPIQLFQCSKCGHVNDHFLPENMTNVN